MTAEFIQLGIFVVLLAVGFAVGRWREYRHLQSLDRRERALAGLPALNLRTVPNPEQIRQATLVTGEAVIATDYFKTFAAWLRGILGGEIGAYNTLLTRARREALLRMLEQARQMGATEVWNVRFETSNILGGPGTRNAAVSVEMLAYGTAVVRDRASQSGDEGSASASGAAAPAGGSGVRSMRCA